MQVLSKASTYGLRALLYIVSQKDLDGYISIRKVAEELDISFHFLTKIFQQLTQNNILESYRGPNGGIMLKMPPEKIFLSDIIKVIDGDDFYDKCLLGLPGCGEFAPCPVHNFWKVTKAAMKLEFDTTSLAELGAKVSDERLRLWA